MWLITIRSVSLPHATNVPIQPTHAHTHARTHTHWHAQDTSEVVRTLGDSGKKGVVGPAKVKMAR